MQLNRRYIQGLQFALAYTLAKGYDTRVTSPYQTEDWFNRAPTGRHAAAQPDDQLHLGRAGRQQRCGTTWFTRGALDGWQLSGNTAFVSGDWAGVTFSTTDNFDFYGGAAPAAASS